MSYYFLQGLVLGLAYVAPIGIQNLYLINTAARETGKRTLEVALMIIFFDIALAPACFFGIGALIHAFPVVQGMVLLSGCVLVTCIGITLMTSQPQLSTEISGEGQSFLTIIGTCFAITWLNPQAIIDGSLLLGGVNASLSGSMSWCFIVGVCLASCFWFASLAALTVQFRTRLNPAIMHWINMVCGAIIIFYGLKLGFSFMQLTL